MKFKREILIISVIVLVLLFSGLVVYANNEQIDCINCKWNNYFGGCTSILVGKDASVDGSTMVTHSADCGLCDYTIKYIPAADHEPNEVMRVYWVKQYTEGETNIPEDSGIDIPQVPHTYAYTKTFFGLMNEHQVGIGESTVISKTSEMLNNNAALLPVTTLSILALERAKTAREAIKIMGELAEKYGYKNYDTMAESLSVGDPKEVWLFEIMGPGPLWKPGSEEPGAVWVAQRVPDDEVGVIANASRIGEIDLNNTDYFMGSPNIYSLAEKMKLWDSKSGEPFSWRKVYGNYYSAAFPREFCSLRVWDAFRLINPSVKIDPKSDSDTWTFSVKPAKKLSVADIMNIHRSTFEGTQYDLTKGLAGGPFHSPYRFGGSPFEVDGKNYFWAHPIAFMETEYTVIQQARDWLSDPIGGITWYGAACNKGTIFIPFYCGTMNYPKAFTVGDHKKFDKNMFWAADFVSMWANLNWDTIYPDIKTNQERIENQQFITLSAIDDAAAKLYKQDPELAVKFVSDWSFNNANQIANEWWDYAESLIVKYNYLGYLGPCWEPGPSYPEEWLKLMDAGNDPGAIPAIPVD